MLFQHQKHSPLRTKLCILDSEVLRPEAKIFIGKTSTEHAQINATICYDYFNSPVTKKKKPMKIQNNHQRAKC